MQATLCIHPVPLCCLTPMVICDSDGSIVEASAFATAHWIPVHSSQELCSSSQVFSVQNESWILYMHFMVPIQGEQGRGQRMAFGSGASVSHSSLSCFASCLLPHPVPLDCPFTKWDTALKHLGSTSLPSSSICGRAHVHTAVLCHHKT